MYRPLVVTKAPVALLIYIQQQYIKSIIPQTARPKRMLAVSLLLTGESL